MLFRIIFLAGFATICMGLMTPHPAWAQQENWFKSYTVMEAYSKLNHRRLVYDAMRDQNLITPEEGLFLNDLFIVTDEAIRLRVLAQMFIDGEEGGISINLYNQEIGKLLYVLSHIEAPERLKNIKKAVGLAIVDNQELINLREIKPYAKERKEMWALNKEELAILDRLRMRVSEAYKSMVDLYTDIDAKERLSEHNTNAFFDQLNPLVVYK